MGFVDGKLKYIKLSFQFQGFKNMNREQAVKFYERIEDLTQNIDKEDIKGLKNGFNSAYDNWCWLYLREIFMKNAI